jgi:hypothetical protein
MRGGKGKKSNLLMNTKKKSINMLKKKRLLIQI